MRNNMLDLDAKGLRKFGYIFGLIVIVLFGVGFPLLFGKGLPLLPWIVGVIFFIWATILVQ